MLNRQTTAVKKGNYKKNRVTLPKSDRATVIYKLLNLKPPRNTVGHWKKILLKCFLELKFRILWQLFYSVKKCEGGRTLAFLRQSVLLCVRHYARRTFEKIYVVVCNEEEKVSQSSWCQLSAKMRFLVAKTLVDAGFVFKHLLLLVRNGFKCPALRYHELLSQCVKIL